MLDSTGGPAKLRAAETLHYPVRSKRWQESGGGSVCASCLPMAPLGLLAGTPLQEDTAKEPKVYLERTDYGVEENANATVALERE
ncbi:hypothetical protein EYF80_022795 [Liparis tanakae]|uniref:Uncharacterized protein n=1 Tax=Liparis tanakae TaxID=230148 RepID=A0A4Z2HQG6_9TELE|nr:hypothetical protein EYF80_022795 [Liparis tanakae]